MEKPRIKPFLTFNGHAEEAMRFYATSLPGAEITTLKPYGKDSPHMKGGEENRVMYGVLSFAGQDIHFLDMSDSYPAPAFNWSVSIYIECVDESEFDVIFKALSQDGAVMMGPESVGHIRKCAWVTDKFGVTWQPVWE